MLSLCPLEAQDLDLHGVIDHRQADSYVLVPFQVPSGIQRLDVSFSYTGKEDHTTLDLGLLDPDRFRGWSGGNKHAFSIGIADATPSYLPGPLPAGTWKLLIGVAYLGEGHTSNYHAHVHLVKTNEARYVGLRRPSLLPPAIAGIAAIFTCTLRTAMAPAPANRERRCLARCSSRSKTQ